MSWKTVRLGDICNTASGGTPSRANDLYWNGNIPWLKSGELNDGLVSDVEEYISEEGLKNSSAKLVKKGTLLLALYGATAGKLGILDFDSSTNQALCAITPIDQKLDSHFLMKYLLFKREKIVKDSIGGAQPNISQAYVRNLQIPLPPLSTQKQISSILDKADALRQQYRQLLNYYDELLQSTFIEMFGDPVRNTKNWKVLSLESICKKITDGTHFSPPSLDKGIPYITAKHVKKHGLDFYSEPTFISQDEHDKIFARCSPSKGDVLYIKDGATTGIAAINEYDFEFSMLSSLALIKVNDKLLVNRYLVSWLNHEKVKHHLLGEFMSGAAIQRFTLTKIKSFKIPVPPIKLQEEFAEISLRIEADRKLISQALVNSLNLFNGLQACIFKN